MRTNSAPVALVVLFAVGQQIAALAAATPVCAGSPTVLNGLFNNCIGTSVYVTCTATCHPGYTSEPAPVAVCQPNGAWVVADGNYCRPVCAGAPDAALLGASGSWPARCTSKTVFNTVCVGECARGYYGTPSILCGAGRAWASTMVGSCKPEPVCSGIPTAVPPIANALPIPASCADTAVSVGYCNTTCQPGYGGAVAPSIACLPDANSTTGGSWGPSSGACKKVCGSMPDASLLVGGTWDTTCTSTAVGAYCSGTCSGALVGSPRIRCIAGGWSASSMEGMCSPAPACNKPLPVIKNGVFPSSCIGITSGKYCSAKCNSGYELAGTPLVYCNGAGNWSTVFPANCEKNPVRDPIAFISTSEGDKGEMVICKLTRGALKSCTSSHLQFTLGGGATADMAFQGIAPTGTRLVFGVNYWQLAVSCAWNPQTLTVDPATCSNVGLAAVNKTADGYLSTRYKTGARDIVMDVASNLAYVITPWANFTAGQGAPSAAALGGVFICRNPANLGGCSLPMWFPNALSGTLSGGYLYITQGGPYQITKCPVNATGFTKAQCVSKPITVSNPPEGMIAGSVSPRAIHIIGNTAIVAVRFTTMANVSGVVSYTAQNDYMAVCDSSTFACTLSDGNGAFKAGGSVGMDSYDGVLYAPNAFSGHITACTSGSTVTGCTAMPVQYLSSNGTMKTLTGAVDFYLA